MWFGLCHQRHTPSKGLTAMAAAALGPAILKPVVFWSLPAGEVRRAGRVESQSWASSVTDSGHCAQQNLSIHQENPCGIHIPGGCGRRTPGNGWAMFGGEFRPHSTGKLICKTIRRA